MDGGPHRAAHRHAPDGGETLPALLGQLVHALLAPALARVPIAVIQGIVTACGLIVLFSPLALWFSWSKAGFFVIIGTGVVTLGIIHLLAWLYPEDF